MARFRLSSFLVPLAVGGTEERLWADFDLGSLAEGRLGDTTDPRTLDEATRATWHSTALDEPTRLPHRRSFERCFWIARGGEWIGILALATSTLNDQPVRLSSLYLLKEHRGRGFGRQVVHAVCERCAAHGLGVRLEAFWTWQRAIRFYLDLGFWLRTWKRELTFERMPALPSPALAISDREGTLSVVDDEGRSILLVRAIRDQARLTLAVEDNLPERFRELQWHASTTLSLAIALRGWPLRRDGDMKPGWFVSDAVHPEGLGRRIQIWEAWSRKHGWSVDTPRIMGLSYPTWGELEVEWRY